MSDEFISLATAARETPPDGVNPSTVFRWVHQGVEVDGERIHLRARYVGRRVVTTRDWVEEFHDAVTAKKLAAADSDDERGSGSDVRDPDTLAALEEAGLLT